MAITIKMKDVGGWVRGPSQQYPQSVYRNCKLTKVEENDNKNVKATFAIGAGAFKGNEITLTLGTGEKKGNHASWLTFLVACKAAKDRDSASKLLIKGIDIEKLVNKVSCAILCTDPADGEQYGDRSPVPPEHIEAMGVRYGFDGESNEDAPAPKKGGSEAASDDDAGDDAAGEASAGGDDEDPLGLNS